MQVEGWSSKKRGADPGRGLELLEDGWSSSKMDGAPERKMELLEQEWSSRKSTSQLFCYGRETSPTQLNVQFRACALPLMFTGRVPSHHKLACELMCTQLEAGEIPWLQTVVVVSACHCPYPLRP
jgi:hypothetical protein